MSVADSSSGGDACLEMSGNAIKLIRDNWMRANDFDYQRAIENVVMPNVA